MSLKILIKEYSMKVVILAGGQGTRLSDIQEQYLNRW